MKASDVYCSRDNTYKQHVYLVPIFWISTGWIQMAMRLDSNDSQTWLCIRISWRVVQTKNAGPVLHSFWCSRSKMQCYNVHLCKFPGDVDVAGTRTTIWGLEEPCDGKRSLGPWVPASTKPPADHGHMFLLYLQLYTLIKQSLPL